MSARLSLKAQLAQLDEPAPIDLDPEDALEGFEHRLFIDHPSATDHYLQVAPSALRKQHESVSDPKYVGVRTSRRQLYDKSDEEPELSGGEDDDDDGEQLEEDDASGQDEHGETDDQESVDELDGSENEDSSHQPHAASARLSDTNTPSPDDPATPPDELHPQRDIASNLRLTHEADKKKGTAVSRQIALWDSLLDARMQLQKAVTAANRLPLPGDLERYTANSRVQEALGSVLDVAGSFIEELFSLQEDLLRLNEQIEVPTRKRRRLETTSDPAREYSTVMEDLSASASVLEASHHPWAVDTLSKWSAKVQAVAPNVLLPDSRGSFMRDGKALQGGVVSVIDELLRSDRAKLLNRTRKRKDKQMRIGERRRAEEGDGIGGGGDEEDALDAEVFDDTDYYQQLLRDVIAARGGGDGSGGEQQWQVEQRERRAKRKKTVDTKASKGRKVRYEVHPKLEHFMVPVPVVGGGWHEEQIDGLFSSLMQS